jgi:phosphoserine phosphatase
MGPRRNTAANRRFIFALLLLGLLTACATKAPQAEPDPLPSWNAGAARQAIVEFVDAVTDPASPDYVAAAERIAVFDNDGTLWSEKPVYFQLMFVVDQIRDMAVEHPEWAHQQPYQAVLEGNLHGLLEQGEPALSELLMTTHAGLTTEAFDAVVRQWLRTARHPESGRPYTEMVYQPMLELLAYLRANGFRNFIVSGGGLGFMRPWTAEVYGIPPEQVVGTSLEMRYEERDGQIAIWRDPSLHHLNDKAGKPVGIERFIGRRPLLAGGNSDGDFEMLEWTTNGAGRRMGLLVHHTDEQREWAYDSESHVGRLARALDEAPARGWVVVDMTRDWRTVFTEVRD